MANHLRYLSQRAVRIPAAIASPTGLVALGASLTGLAAVFSDGSLSRFSAAVSLVLWFGTVLMLADRVRIASRMACRADRQVKASATVQAAMKKPERSELRLSSARALIAQIAPASEHPAPSAGETGRVPSEASPKVTVVVPCYNESEFLHDCLDSLLSQTFDAWECIVVDDASTDDSAAVAWGYSQRDDRIRVARHTRNGGLSAARNTGLRLAKGGLITFLDSDDFLMPDSLADRMLHLVPHMYDESVAGVYCGVTLAPADATPADYVVSDPWKGAPKSFVTDGDRCPFNVHAGLVRTELIRAAGGANESMPYGAEDWDLWYRVMRNGYRFVPSGRVTAVYRQKQSSMRRRHALEHFEESSKLTKLSHRPADDGVFFESAFGPMPLPKYEYEISSRLAYRSIQSAATALLSGDVPLSVSMLESIEPVHPTVLAAAGHFERAIIDGFRRYLGLSLREYQQIEGELVSVGSRMTELVSDHVRVEDLSNSVRRRQFDVLLAPQTSYELLQMVEAVADTNLDVGLVDSSLVAGEQGVAEVVAGGAVGELLVLSYNEALLGPVDARLVVLSYPWDAALEEMALSFVARGTRVASLPSELEDILRISESPASRIQAARISVEDLAIACRHADLGSLLEAIPAPSRSGRDTSASSGMDSASAWTIEEYPALPFDATDMQRFKGIHAGERVVIIGNGPSLNELDLSLLKGTATFGVNGIFYADERLPEPLTYYVVEDTMVVRDNLERIKTYEAGHRFFPTIYREMIGESPNSTFFMMNRGFYAASAPGFCVPRFSTDAAQRVYAGQSVTIMNLQLAYYMGFTEVILIGMDFSYTVPESSEVKGTHITSMGDDPNHFHPDYFGKGKVWKDPKLERVLASYALAKQMFEADGRRIVNATPGGNLHLFDRVPFEELFSA
ncbi:MAG: glycosyltransferase [Actinomycetia bacterium]|nr:glycosyltransferase [Actinomycetes bacterium]